MATLSPRIEGDVPIRSAGSQFLERFRHRVSGGLLAGKPHPRSNYTVIDNGPAHVAVRAADWWTAINVGLNDLDLALRDSGVVHYRVRYWRWSAYAIGVSALLGSIGIALLSSLDVRAYISGHPSSRLPWFSVEQNLAIAWLMVLFWGFVWPWMLIALHKRPLHRVIRRLIAEVDSGAALG